MREIQQDEDPTERSYSTPATIAIPSATLSNVVTIPKNRSTGNLLGYTERQSATRIRFSVDGEEPREYDTMTGSPLLPEHEHGLGTSGLRRIRQQPSSRAPSRAGTLPSSPERSFSNLSRSSSMNLNVQSARSFHLGGPSSPTMNFGEDLRRFPYESLHSFSFAHQSEDALYNRTGLLRKSLEFIRERTGLSSNHPGILKAQAKISGDPDAESIVELLDRAKALETRYDGAARLARQGPLTGPANVDNNIFDKNFGKQSESPEAYKENLGFTTSLDVSVPSSRPGSSQSKGFGVNQALALDEPILDPLEVERSKTRPRVSRLGLRRTYTDTGSLQIQTKLTDVMAKPYRAIDPANPSSLLSCSPTLHFSKSAHSQESTAPMQGPSPRWSPAAQAIFSTETQAPWTILAANDLACLVFGVTRAEVRKLGILEVIKEDRREWLEAKLRGPGSEAETRARSVGTKSAHINSSPSTLLTLRGGITAMLLRKPNSRQIPNNRSQTGDGSGSRGAKNDPNISPARGVLLCGDIIPIQKRNGSTGSASLWVKEKPGYLIWVVEEIVEDTASLTLDEEGKVLSADGALDVIWGTHVPPVGVPARRLIPRLPFISPDTKTIDYDSISRLQYFTAKNSEGLNIPITVSVKANLGELRVSNFPHMAGIVVLSAANLEITSANPVFSTALFGQPDPKGLHITELIPNFVKILELLIDEEHVDLVDGIVIPEHSFRRARTQLASREGGTQAAAALFLQSTGLRAKHRDRSELYVDVQMRVVKSERSVADDNVIEEGNEDMVASDDGTRIPNSEVVYALWITYSRNIHSFSGLGSPTPMISRPGTPPRQPSPGQSITLVQAPHLNGDDDSGPQSPSAQIRTQIEEATSEPISMKPNQQPVVEIKPDVPVISEPPRKKSISDFVILEEMGQGAYGQVKLARSKKPPSHKFVLKYVTKKRILVDTWTRDRKLGTVPLEIHVLNYLRKDELRHPNIVEMIDFFEDNINYYIEMVPHGLPGMDLFDYIEMRSTMDEAECKNIFLQVVAALHHLHTKALVVHRDIKDENIILDGDNKVKLIDFGSAAYIKNGPFDVFVGTIDYAAPEVLQGRPYEGKAQDVWALGILLYTLVYKENPFYSVDEILDHELRVPWVMSDGSIDLIRAMLNRDVEMRISIENVQSHPWCAGTEDSD